MMQLLSWMEVGLWFLAAMALVLWSGDQLFARKAALHEKPMDLYDLWRADHEARACAAEGEREAREAEWLEKGAIRRL